jgi:hypothetical protein
VNLGIALFEANNHETLINVVLTEGYRAQPIDPLRNKEVYIERTKLAMKVSSAVNDNPTFFKLAFIAADVAKTDMALKNLLISNADIAALFGNTDSLHKIHLQSEEKSWSGSFHYQLAAIYARQSNIELAKKHLKNAEKWIDWMQRQKDTDRYDNRYSITDADIAFGAEAYLRIYGSQRAFKWLNSWTPKDAVFHATRIMIHNVLPHCDKEQITEWLSPLKLPIYAKLLILNTANSYGIGCFDLKEIVDTLTKMLSRGIKFEPYLLPPVINFCELLIKANLSYETLVKEILSFIKFSLPERVPSFSGSRYGEDDLVRIKVYMRKVTLLAALERVVVKKEDIYPEVFKDIEKNKEKHTKAHLNQQKIDFDRFYRHAVAIYQLRADCLVQKELNIQFIEICKNIKGDWDWRYRDSYWIHDKLNYLALVLLDVVPFLENPEESLNTLIDSFQEKEQNNISLRLAIASVISTIEGLEKHAIRLFDAVDTIIQNATFASSDIVDYYIQMVRISLDIDKGISKFYFDKAIKAVQEIDLEAIEQIKCIYGFAEMGLPNANPKLAFEFARFVEYSKSRLGYHDGFPIGEGTEGVAHLDCASAFGVLCRWSHRYVVDIEDHILSILHISLDKGFISPSVGSSLLPMNIYYWKTYVAFVKTLLAKFNAVGNSTQKSYFVKNLLRDLKINCGNDEKKATTQAIYEAIKDGQFIAKDVLVEFEEYNSFLANLCENKQDSNDLRYNSSKVVRPDIDTKSIDITSTSSLNNALAQFSDENTEGAFFRLDIDDLLLKIKENCRSENYVPHLDAFLNIDPELITFYSFRKALEARLTDWDFHPLVKQWKTQKFDYFLKLWFSHFCYNDHINFDSITDFASYFSINQAQLMRTIISILPEKIDELEARALYETIQFIKHRLTPKENEEVITWALQRWNAPIKEEFGDGVWNEKYNPIGSSDDVIAQTLRFTLAHPDKRIRWRGVHALRRLVNSGNVQILRSLLIHQNDKNCLPFQHKEYTFFWISAKLYLWVCIARLSKEMPKQISAFKNEMLKELQNQELPHVLIVYFIKKACLNLHAFDDILFSEDELALITNALTSPFAPISEKESIDRKETNDSEYKTRFDFNPLDTLPYWYQSLSRCFNLLVEDVADIADKYITERWGYAGNIHNDNHVKATDGDDYLLTSNHKGSLPTVENLRTYYEYHAMFCAAGELLKKEPFLESDSYEPWESWDYWLNSNSLVWSDYWLSDLRGSLPLDKKFWLSEFKKTDEEWVKNIDDEILDEAVGFSAQSEPNTIIPFGNHTRYFGEHYERIAIKSTIVTLKTSEALLRALQTTKDNYDYTIPLEEGEHQIDTPDFSMKGWLKVRKSEYEGLDIEDPFADRANRFCICLGDSLNDCLGIDYSDDFKTAFYKGVTVSSFKSWSNMSKYKRYDNLDSEGGILEVNIDFLLAFLKEKNVGMIVQCQVERQLEERDYKREDSKRNKIVKLYLICPDGEVKTLRGRHYKIG